MTVIINRKNINTERALGANNMAGPEYVSLYAFCHASVTIRIYMYVYFYYLGLGSDMFHRDFEFQSTLFEKKIQNKLQPRRDYPIVN